MLFSQCLPDGDPVDQRVHILPLSARERAFLLEAVHDYCATRCPLATGEGTCPALTWRESPHHRGALEKTCAVPPTSWAPRLAPEEEHARHPLTWANSWLGGVRREV